MKFIREQVTEDREIFMAIHQWCDKGEAKKHVLVGDRVVFPALHVPATKCGGEDFPEIDLKDVSATVVHVELHRVVFCFDDILLRHDVGSECSGRPFDETPLGVWLTTCLRDALRYFVLCAEVKVSLLSKENVFDEASAGFMPYFKPVKNRIKVLADKNGTWYWWLKTPGASNASYFCYVVHYGNSYDYLASSSDGGVAPCFEITGRTE